MIRWIKLKETEPDTDYDFIEKKEGVYLLKMYLGDGLTGKINTELEKVHSKFYGLYSEDYHIGSTGPVFNEMCRFIGFNSGDYGEAIELKIIEAAKKYAPAEFFEKDYNSSANLISEQNSAYYEKIVKKNIDAHKIHPISDEKMRPEYEEPGLEEVLEEYVEPADQKGASFETFREIFYFVLFDLKKELFTLTLERKLESTIVQSIYEMSKYVDQIIRMQGKIRQI